MIINHDTTEYRKKWERAFFNQWNGAFFYSKEICKYIIPSIKTDRNWITVNVKGVGCDHAIVFVHNNLHPEHYDWLSKYDDLILVCGVRETCQKVKHLGKAIYLPLSVDVEDVKKYRTEKTKDIAFAGRRAKRKGIKLPKDIEYLEGLPRTEFLKELAKFRRVFAVGRVAIEAKILGCKVLPYDERYPYPRRWRILDSRDAVPILQEKLDKAERSLR